MRRPSLVLAGVCAGWGTVGLAVRAVPLPATAIACARVWLAALGLAGVLAVSRSLSGGRSRGFVWPDRHRARVVVTGVVLGLHWLSFIAALQRAPMGTVALIVFLGPVGVAALAPRTLGERSSPRTLAALAVAVGGYLLVAGPGARGAEPAGVVLALFAGFSFVALVICSKPLASIYGGLHLAFYELVVASVVLLPVGLVAAWGRPRGAWLWLLVLGLVHTAAGASLYLAALARVPAVHAGILGYLEPAGAIVCGWLFLAEAPGVATVAGGLLIVAAGTMVVRASASQPELASLAASAVERR